MPRRGDREFTPTAQALRRNMTRAERRLWYDCLKELPVGVHRQKVIGGYIVDFYISSARLVIELDGSQHFEPEGRNRDSRRDAYLQGLGLRVLRYSNDDVNNRFTEVCDDILRAISAAE